MATPLKIRITQLGLKNKYVADKTEVHPTVMSMYVTGRRVPPLEDALKIAHVLRTDVETLWGNLINDWSTTYNKDHD